MRRLIASFALFSMTIAALFAAPNALPAHHTPIVLADGGTTQPF